MIHASRRGVRRSEGPRAGRMHLAFCAFAPTLLLASCLTDPEGSSRRLELERARTLWTDAAIVDYRYQVRQLCFCGHGGQRVVVEVRGGVVVGATLVDTGEAMPENQLQWGAPSVEDLFDRLESILEGDPAAYEVTFDPQLGYPRSASTDPIENAIDDEWGVEAGDLEPLG